MYRESPFVFVVVRACPSYLSVKAPVQELHLWYGKFMG